MAKVNVIGKHYPFGGQTNARKETSTGYTYTCLDYTRLLFGKESLKYTNCLISTIIKDFLKDVGMPTSGIQKSTIKHASIVINNQKVIDIFQQLANLDGMEFFVKRDGIPILRDIPDPTSGYVFMTTQMVSDYSLDLDDSSIITGVTVYGAGNKLLYEYGNSKMVLKYGPIGDIIEDSNISDKEEAKALAVKDMYDAQNQQFAGTLVIPDVIDIYKGEWIVLVPPSWSKSKTSSYYVQQVEIKEDSNGKQTTITFLNGKPSQPSNWIYTDPVTGEEQCNVNMNSVNKNQVCAVGKPSVKDGYPYVNFRTCVLNYCPVCKLYGFIHFGVKKGVPEGEYNCNKHKVINGKRGCDSDFDIVKGKVKLNWDHRHLTILSGPTRTTKKVGPATPTASIVTCTNATKSTTTTRTATGLAKRLPASVKTISQLYQWFHAHIKYLYYWNSRYTPTQVMSRGYGNCVDQSKLAVELLTGLGFTAKAIHLYVTGNCGTFKGGHEHVLVLVSGKWKIWDTTCHKLSQIH